jgi:hypothetical protein
MQEAMELSRERLGSEGNPKMIQSYSQNSPARYYPEKQHADSSSEFTALQSTVSNNTQILYITARYEKNDLFAKQNGKKYWTRPFC